MCLIISTWLLLTLFIPIAAVMSYAESITYKYNLWVILSYAQNCQSCENLTFHTTVCYLKTEISLWQMTPWLSFDTWWRRCQSLTSFKTVCFLHQLCFVLPVCACKLSGQLICMREVLCSRGLQLNWIKPFENLEWEALSNISLIKLCKWTMGWCIGLMVYCAVSN